MTTQHEDRELLELASRHVPVGTPGDIFENAVRFFGIVNACEWFGHKPDSEFTKETIRVLADRAAASIGKGEEKANVPTSY